MRLVTLTPSVPSSSGKPLNVVTFDLMERGGTMELESPSGKPLNVVTFDSGPWNASGGAGFRGWFDARPFGFDRRSLRGGSNAVAELPQPYVNVWFSRC
ncbi:MAG: hypothetical protein JWM27_1202 [Gemmatimonadetes bacterium]|nr:hypothetical protein [Gemmatimonadota bacterium]